MAALAVTGALALTDDADTRLRMRPETPVTAIDLQHERSQNSPVLAVDPTDGRFVVAASRVDGPEFDCALHVSGDGGRSWLPVEPVPELPEGAERCYAPEVAFGADGRLYYLFVGLHGQGNAPMGAFLVTSDDRGQTFSAPEQLLGANRYMVRLALDTDQGSQGRLHLVWVEATSPPPVGGFGPPPNPVMAAHSDDGGATWSDPVQVSDPDRDRVVAPAVVVDDGAVHVAYYDLQDDVRDYQGLEGPAWGGTWSLVVSSSLDGGQRFTRHRVVDDGVVAGERVMLIFTTPPPALAVDRAGRLFAAWADARHGDRDVLLRRSPDAGETWESPVRVNDDPLASGRDQHLPRVGVSPEGRVDVVFADRRDDPDNTRQHVFYAYSTDAGASFSPNVQVTEEASDTRTGPRYPIPSARGLVEFGSRQALVSQPAGVLLAWPDTRLPFQGLLHQDIFTTRITVPPAGRTWPEGWLLVGVGGLLAVLWRLRRRRARRGLPHTPTVAVLVAAAVAAAGCAPTGAEDADTVPLPPSAATVRVSLDEYHFGGLPDAVPAGRVVFEVANVGERDHELVLVGIPDNFPSTIDEQFRPGADRQAFPTLVHLRTRRPGQRGVFAMDLGSGRYGLICFIEDADGRRHAHKGMTAEFRVGRNR